MKQKQKPKSEKANAAVKKPAPASDEIREFVEEQRKLKKALAAAEERVAGSERELAEARRALAEAESARLAEDPESVDGVGSPESDEFVAASLKLEQARAAFGGVQRRIRNNDLNLLSVCERLRAEREEYNRTTIAQFLEKQFEPAAAAFAVILRRGDALARALDCEIAEIRRLPERGDWQEDEDAKRLYAEHSGLRQLASALAEFQHDAELRVVVEERNRQQRAAFDPTARYTVIRTFQCYGREFNVGDVVDKYTLDLKVMGQLYDAKRLRLIEPKEEWAV